MHFILFNMYVSVLVILHVTNCVWCRNVQGIVVNNTLTLGFTLPWTQEWMIGQHIGSGIILGIEEVYRRNILPEYEIEWTWRDSYCQPYRGVQMAVDMWSSMQDLDGIIGDGCSVVCEPIALLAASWGIPIISWGCTSDALSDKSVYPTFTRVEGTWAILAPVLNDVADQFGWTRIAIIYTPEDINKHTANSIRQVMEQSGKKIFMQLVEQIVRGTTIHEERLQAQQAVLESIKKLVRIIILIAYPSEALNLMLSAQKAGMVDGKFAFVCPKDGITISHPVFDGVIGVGTRNPSGPDFDHFLRQILVAFQDPRFDGIPHLDADANIKDIHFYAGNILYCLFILP